MCIRDSVKRGLKGSTVRNALDPLRRIFTRAVQRDLIPFSPCQNLDVPRATGTRDRIATPTEAATLIAALEIGDRALWATLFYAGLRMGEARALRCRDVDAGANVLRVSRSWDDKEGVQDRGKSKAATREVAIIGELRPFLMAHMLATGRRGEDLIFGRTVTDALTRSTVRTNALRAWRKAKLAPITPHECRHTYGSMLAAAGIDVGERQRQIGHSSSAMTDRYTHGFDGSIADAGARLQLWLDEQRAKATG